MMNVVPGRLMAGDSGPVVECLGRQFHVRERLSVLAGSSPRDVVVGVRPEDVIWVREPHSGPMQWKARVEVVEPLGAETYVVVAVAGVSLTLRVPARSSIRVRDELVVDLVAARLHIFDQGTGETMTGS